MDHLFKQLGQAIRQADRILLTTHQKPDGDALGASSALLNWLLRENKNVTAFCLDAPPQTFHYLDNIHLYTQDPKIFDQSYDLIIVLDSGDLQHCGITEYLPRLPGNYQIANLDHHVTNTNYGHFNLVMPQASSASEVVFHFFEANKIFIDPKMATSLLTGILTDTGNFSNSLTSAESLGIAGKLFSAGARYHEIAHHIHNYQTIDTLKLWGILLSRLNHNLKYDMATTYILQEDLKNLPSGIEDGLTNFLSSMVGQTDTIMVLKELPTGEVKGSLRSKSRDISKLAQRMGGGGHKLAAGFTVKGRIKVTPQGPVITGA
jgi:phosphoesterase RecJ-like protein